jgi:hypothetical protein
MKKTIADKNPTRCVSAHVAEDVYWRLRKVAVDQRIEMREAVEAAVDLYIEKHKHLLSRPAGHALAGASLTPEPG